MVPGWKGGKALPLGGSFGEYSLNDFEEQPKRETKKGFPRVPLGSALGRLLRLYAQELVFWSTRVHCEREITPESNYPIF